MIEPPPDTKWWQWYVKPKDAHHWASQQALIPDEARGLKGRVWFYKPKWYWHGFTTLLPVHVTRLTDDYGRRTILFGWTITGRMVIALKTCYCGWCDYGREQTHQYENETE